MKKLIIIIGLLFVYGVQKTDANDAPITTAGTVSTSASSAVIPITAENFTYIGSCRLELHYDPAIATATLVTIGPELGGSMNYNITNPGVVIIGWYAYPAITLPGTPVIFNITFSKVTSGTTALTWYDDGYSCYYSDGDYIILNDEPTSSFYINGTLTFTGTLVADFSADNTTPPENTTVHFTDLTTGGPTSWAWSFNRSSVVYVNGTDSTTQNPQVQFTAGGLYTVTLVVHNTGNTDTKIKVDYIRAGIAGKWTGATSSEWLTTTNWDNWLVPGSSTDVVVPTSASFWPIFTGNFTIGTTCKSVTLNGASQMTINGNIMINAGSSLTFSGAGVLFIAGNWTNAGTFSAGSGTVNFTGNNPASILSGGTPPVINTFYNMTISKTGATLTIIPDININGDLVLTP